MSLPRSTPRTACGGAIHKNGPTKAAMKAPAGNAKWLNPFQHALIRPDMYIGSVKVNPESKWVAALNPETNKYVTKKYLKFPYNEGLERIHIELISNAIDNIWRSLEQGIPMTKISFTFDIENG